MSVPSARAAAARSGTSQEELWLAGFSAAPFWGRAGAVQKQIRAMLAARANQQRDLILRPVNRSVLAQAHVLGEVLGAASHSRRSSN